MTDPRPLRRIVVGVDLGPGGTQATPGSELAVSQARVLASRSGAEVWIAHSTAHDEHWSVERAEYVERQGLEEPGKQALDVLVQELRDAGIEAELAISEESAAQAVVDTARAHDANLVLVGKRSCDTDRGPRLGRVAKELVHECPCAVWVVRPASRPEPEVVLCAVDLGPLTDHVLDTAAAVTRVFDAELHVTHALTLPLDVQVEPHTAREEYLRERRDEAEARIHAGLAGAGFEDDVATHVGLTSPTQAVLSGEEHLAPDLVVMGTVARSGLSGFVLGNTAERLVDRLDCSLLVVKPPAEPDA